MPSPPSHPFDLPRLRAAVAPARVHYFPTLRSTNSHAAVLRKRGDLFAPAIVLTARQTAGRGRGGNTWFSRPGNLTVTFVLPAEPHLHPHQLPLLAGLAVRNAAAELAGDDAVQLKWPNDLLHKDRKLAGLLCERTSGVDLIGLGLNVNLSPPLAPKDLRDKIVSLRSIAQGGVAMAGGGVAMARGGFDLTGVLTTVWQHLRQTLGSRHSRLFPVFLKEYDRHHALVGRTVTITHDHAPTVTGKCLGLDDTGRLLVKDRRTVVPVIAGHVVLTPRA